MFTESSVHFVSLGELEQKRGKSKEVLGWPNTENHEGTFWPSQFHEFMTERKMEVTWCQV